MIFSAILLAAFCLQGNRAQDAAAYYLSCGPTQLNEEWMQFTGVAVENINVETTGNFQFLSKDWELEKTPKDPTGSGRYPMELYTNFMYLQDGDLSMTFTITPFVEYSIVMHFIEPKWNKDRSFNILLNDYLAPALEGLSIETVTKGVRRPLAATMNLGMMKSDSLKVTLQPVQMEAILCAIEIYPTGYWREPVPIAEVQELEEVEEVQLVEETPAPAPAVLEEDEEEEEYTAPAPALLPLETPDFSRVYKISTEKYCWQAEDPFCGLQNFDQDLWTFETSPEAEGCGFMRWGDDNHYRTDMITRFPDIVICYKVDIATAGDYLLEVGGTRTTFGRVETNCGELEAEKAVDREECAAIEGVECFCSDEENDIWTSVDGPQINVATDAKQWLKHMMNCKADTWCTRDIINYEHENTPAIYSLKEGEQEVCIAGRSKFVGVDFLCLDYQGPPTLTGDYTQVPELEEPEVTTEEVDVGAILEEGTHEEEEGTHEEEEGTHEEEEGTHEEEEAAVVEEEAPVVEQETPEVQGI